MFFQKFKFFRHREPEGRGDPVWIASSADVHRLPRNDGFFMSKEKQIKFNGQTIKILWRDDSDQSVIDEIFVDRMYRALEPIIPSLTDPIIDVGAHIGLFSIYTRLLNTNAPIIALEPEPKNFAMMKKNLKLNRVKNIITKQIALAADETPTTTLYLSENNHNHSTIQQFNNSTIQQFITVPAINLAQLIEENKIKKIGLLKMDIEGAEFAIARNMEHVTWNKIQYCAIEYHPAPHGVQGKSADYLSSIIRPHGFSVEHFPNKFDKRFGLLVCRNKKSPLLYKERGKG